MDNLHIVELNDSNENGELWCKDYQEGSRTISVECNKVRVRTTIIRLSTLENYGYEDALLQQVDMEKVKVSHTI